MKELFFICGVFLLVTIISCGEDPIVIEHDTTPYQLDFGHFPPPPALPDDNLLTVQKVKLGRMLFYEPMLSSDESMSCASCHLQEDVFSDKNQFSEGVRGELGKRQAMPIFNMAYHTNQFFWDGRANLLRDQSLKPIQDALEMDETLENVVMKLSESQEYKDQFVRAFGSEEIDTTKISLALEQFMMSIVSNNSKYDQHLNGEYTMTPSEQRGMELYFTEYNPFFPEESGADCAHCHGGINFENDRYMNNGLDTEENWTDLGRYNVTTINFDKARFKVPSLRNIELSGPYMHDGRFETLEEVIDHYDHGIQISPSLDQALLATTDTGLQLSDQDKEDLIAFLKTLTDETLFTNEEYSDPFQ